MDTLLDTRPILATNAPVAPPVAPLLLDWYDRERRELPWRFAPGVAADPYHVWLSEIMLQQTTVKAVVPFFNAFLSRWPTVGQLAAADLDAVLAAWAGLGYYSRARNLHACARIVAIEHGGIFPETEAELTRLPGIGSYTAAAIAAIGYGHHAVVVDGNVERVVARLFAIDTPLPTARPLLRRATATITPSQRCGDFAQAMMDLGATVCTPRRPSCMICPIATSCEGRTRGIAETLPQRAAKTIRPERHAHAFVALREDGAILLRRRPPVGLLGGMMEVPSTAWTGGVPGPNEALTQAPLRADWWLLPGQVVHVFTHFRLQMQVYRALVPIDATPDLWASPENCLFIAKRELPGAALPSLMRKIIAHAFQHDAPNTQPRKKTRTTG